MQLRKYTFHGKCCFTFHGFSYSEFGFNTNGFVFRGTRRFVSIRSWLMMKKILCAQNRFGLRNAVMEAGHDGQISSGDKHGVYQTRMDITESRIL